MHEDGILELQLCALEWITLNQLEGAFNIWMIHGAKTTQFQLIDFVINYCQDHRDSILEKERSYQSAKNNTCNGRTKSDNENRT